MKLKNPLILFSLVIGLVFIGCGKKNEQLIIGKWKIEDITAPHPNFEELPDSLREYYQKQIEIQTTLLLSTGYYEFKKGGKCFFELDGTKSEGKWRLSDDQKKLFTKEKGSASEIEFDIKDLTEGVFTIESMVDGKMRRMVMKKYVN